MKALICYCFVGTHGRLHVHPGPNEHRNQTKNHDDTQPYSFGLVFWQYVYWYYKVCICPWWTSSEEWIPPFRIIKIMNHIIPTYVFYVLNWKISFWWCVLNKRKKYYNKKEILKLKKSKKIFLNFLPLNNSDDYYTFIKNVFKNKFF